MFTIAVFIRSKLGYRSAEVSHNERSDRCGNGDHLIRLFPIE